VTPAELALAYLLEVEGSTPYAVRWVDGAASYSKPHQPEFPPIRLDAQGLRQSVHQWAVFYGHVADVHAVALAVVELLLSERLG